MDENFSFGYWLRRQRLARDLRQADLAEQLCIATITLRKIEADERRPSPLLIERLVHCFGLSEEECELLRAVIWRKRSPDTLALPQRFSCLANDPCAPARASRWR